MASAESISVEFDTSGGRGGSGGGGGAGGGPRAPDSGLWEQVKFQLHPLNHSLCENILAGVVFVMFIVVIALAATHGGGSSSGRSLSSTCQTQQCLFRSAGSVAYANLTASPCDDFYKFACGMAPYSLRLSQNQLERTAVGELVRYNEDRLETILRSAVARDTPNSYERKLKTFFGTCVNDFLTERIRGAPLAMYLARDFYLMNASAVNRFDMTDMMLKAYMIYGADVFFEYFITDNYLDGDKYTISIDKGGLEMPVASYVTDSPMAAKHREAYKSFIRSVANFLVMDAEPGSVAPGASDRVEDLVTDVLDVETELARVAQSSLGPEAGKQPLHPDNMPTLQQMDASYPAISWSKFFIESFRPNVLDSTKVAVQDPDYLKKLSEGLQRWKAALYPTPALFNRKVSNYMNWRIISRHSSDLSSGYVHARREFQAALSVRPYVFESRFDQCFRKVRHFMRQGVSALFVADHLSDANTRAVDDMYRNIQKELASAVDRLTWQDASARDKAKEKVRAVQDLIGYSPTEVGNAYLDKYYETLSADKDNHLLDMSVSWVNFRRERQGALLGKQPDRNLWDGATYDTNLFMNNEKVQLTVPAGIIQWPIYTANLPSYINYATLGQRIGAEFIKSIDATGQLFDKDGKTNPMWTAQTTLNYVQRATCLNQTFSALRAGPYVTESGSQYVNIDKLISRHLRNVIAGADGLRLAMRTYLGLGLVGREAPLPLAQLNPPQMFIMSWAQTYCYSRTPEYSITRAETSRNMPEESLVNGILTSMPEFAQIFRCPANSKMVRPAGTCAGVFYV